MVGSRQINYTVFSIEGRPILMIELTSQMERAQAELDLNNYSAGVYFITFEIDGKTQTQRFILE